MSFYLDINRARMAELTAQGMKIGGTRKAFDLALEEKAEALQVPAEGASIRLTGGRLYLDTYETIHTYGQSSAVWRKVKK